MLKVNLYWTPPWFSLVAAWGMPVLIPVATYLSFWLEAGLKPANIIGLSVPDAMDDRSVIYSSPSCNNWGWKPTGSPRVKVT